MTKTLTDFVKALKTAQLVALYNMANEPDDFRGKGKPLPPVKKFSDRPTAEKRIVKMITTWDDAQNTFDGYNEFYGQYATKAHKIGIDLPTPEEKDSAIIKAVPENNAKVKIPTTAEAKEAKKVAAQKTPPHLNLRCPVLGCGYYAKTTPAWLKKGRLVCPMDKTHGKLETADERGEKRGRDGR